MSEETESIDQLRYPIGRYVRPETLSSDERIKLIDELESLPLRLDLLSQSFDDSNLGNTYREGSWTARQVFHHIADSHINSFTRLKLALTEDKPEIRPYDENEWALLPDYTEPIHLSLDVIRAIHPIMVHIYRGLNEDQWKRTFYHPGYKQWNTIEQLLALYVWHGNHHEAHLKLALSPKG
jgi:DinB superfamily